MLAPFLCPFPELDVVSVSWLLSVALQWAQRRTCALKLEGFFLQVNLRSGIDGSYGSFVFHFFFFLGTYVLFSIAADQFTFPLMVYENSLFSISSSPYPISISSPTPTLVMCCLFDNSCLTDVRWCLIVVLICISWITSDVEHLYVFFRNMSAWLFLNQIVALFLIELCECLYIFNVADIWFAKFSIYWAIFSFCWWLSLLCRNFLIQSHLFIFGFSFKKSPPRPISRTYVFF